MRCIQCKRLIDEATEPFVQCEERGKGLHDTCHDGYKRRLDERQRLVKMVKPLIDEVNGGSPSELAEAIVEALTSSHRTLQQSFLGAVRMALHQYATLDPGMYVDARNNCAHLWAKDVAKLPYAGLRFPLI